MASSKSKLGKTFAWVLMTFVIIGLGGFGAVNFSSSDNAVASVGETEISSREYARAPVMNFDGFLLNWDRK